VRKAEKFLPSFALALSVWLAAGCNALLGVKELQADLDAGSVGGSGDAAVSGAGRGGHSGAGGENAAAGSGGRSGNASGDDNDAGIAGSSGASGEPSEAGSGGSAGTSAAGDAGAAGHAGGAGGAPADTGAVQGRVIDYRRNPLANALVRIGDQSTMTDAGGNFSIADVASSYDVTLTIHTNINSTNATIAWRVEGLTRRDPTLQVYRGLPDRTTTLDITISHVTFPLASMQKISFDWTSVDGDFGDDLDSASTSFLSAGWVGPAQSQGNAHALLFNYDANEIPTAYLAHDAHAVVLTDGTDGQVTFDLTPGTLPTGTITGITSGSISDERHNHVFLRFNDGAAIKLLSEDSPQNSFSYLVPQIANSSLTLVAENEIYPGFAAAYADNIAPGQSAIALSVPPMPTLSAPGDGKNNVDGDTLFQWSGSAHVYLYCARSVPTYDSMCVLTSNSQAKLPVSPLSDYAAPTNSEFNWEVETHGDLASVDDASGSDGFLSVFSYETLRGPARGNGSYAQSVQRSFTTSQ
jgi:hypothetical protein